MDLLSRLRSDPSLTATEVTVAGYILANPDEAVSLSSRELAHRTYSSAATVSRLCKKLGYTSFNDFKIDLVTELRKVEIQGTDIQEGESALAIANKVATLELHTITETRRKLSLTTLNAISGLLESARYIDFLATDANATIAQYASHNFTLARRISTVYENLDKMIYMSLIVPRDHVVFLISKSGTDHTLLETARILKRREIHTVAVVADTSSELAGLCEHVFEGFYYREFDKFGDVVFGSAAKYLFDLLFVKLFSEDYEGIRAINHFYDEIYYSRLDRARGPETMSH